jgi:2-hydroxyglutarate dehydrogenase
MGTTSEVEASVIVNAAGLHCHDVASLVLEADQLKGYGIHYAKGHYFSWRLQDLIQRLIYPVPDKSVTSLGVHLTVDLSGKIKFGPDVTYTDAVDYLFTSDPRSILEAVQTYLPSIKLQDIEPDYVGVRPKLQGKGEGFRDFHIVNQDGFVNLMGIESVYDTDLSRGLPAAWR